MVIKKWKNDEISCISYDLHKICIPCFEKLPKDLNKINQLFARIPYNNGKPIKI